MDTSAKEELMVHDSNIIKPSLHILLISGVIVNKFCIFVMILRRSKYSLCHMLLVEYNCRNRESGLPNLIRNEILELVRQM